MEERIKEIISYYQLTSSAFADKIGVQRSGISHILSGRNKPSYDFLVSLINEFPDINPGWLLTGKGTMLSESANSSELSGKAQNTVNTDKTENIFDNRFVDYSLSTRHFDSSKIDSYKSKQGIVDHRSIDYIVIFYSDGGFRRYFSD